MVFYILAAVFFVIGIICSIYDCFVMFGESYASVPFFVIAIILFLIGLDHPNYKESIRYELQSYEVIVEQESGRYSQKCIAKSIDGVSFDVELHDISKEGDKLLLIKYEAKKPIVGTSFHYDLILPEKVE